MKHVMQWDALGWFQASGPFCQAGQAAAMGQVSCSLLSSHLHKNWSFPFIFSTSSFFSGLLSYCLLHAVFLSHSLFFLLPQKISCLFSTARSSATSPSNCLIFPLLIFPGKALVWVFSKEYTFIKRRLLTNAVIWSHGWPSLKVWHFSPVSQNTVSQTRFKWGPGE